LMRMLAKGTASLHFGISSYTTRAPVGTSSSAGWQATERLAPS
jgi:hypothetical protein